MVVLNYANWNDTTTMAKFKTAIYNNISLHFTLSTGTFANFDSIAGYSSLYQLHRDWFATEGILNSSYVKSFNIDAQVVGRVEAFEGKKLTIESEYGTFEY